MAPSMTMDGVIEARHVERGIMGDEAHASSASGCDQGKELVGLMGRIDSRTLEICARDAKRDHGRHSSESARPWAGARGGHTYKASSAPRSSATGSNPEDATPANPRARLSFKDQGVGGGEQRVGAIVRHLACGIGGLSGRRGAVVSH